MNEKNIKDGLLIIFVSMFILSVLFFVGNFFIGGKGGNLCNIFFGFIMVILGLSYLLVSVLLNNFGVKVRSKVLSREWIHNNPFRDRCYVAYNIDGKNYTNWVIGKSVDFKENEEISILVLKKHPRIVMSKYQNNLFMVIMMLIILIVELCIIFGNLAVLF